MENKAWLPLCADHAAKFNSNLPFPLAFMITGSCWLTMAVLVNMQESLKSSSWSLFNVLMGIHRPITFLSPPYRRKPLSLFFKLFHSQIHLELFTTSINSHGLFLSARKITRKWQIGAAHSSVTLLPSHCTRVVTLCLQMNIAVSEQSSNIFAIP